MRSISNSELQAVTGGVIDANGRGYVPISATGDAGDSYMQSSGGPAGASSSGGPASSSSTVDPETGLTVLDIAGKVASALSFGVIVGDDLEQGAQAGEQGANDIHNNQANTDKAINCESNGNSYDTQTGTCN